MQFKKKGSRQVVRMHLTVFFSLFFALMILPQTQTFPFVTLHDAVLPNHSYVPFGEVEDDTSDSGVECHTDLATCCTSEQGKAAGAWYFPNGTRLPFDQLTNTFTYMRRRSGKIVLYERMGGSASYSGIYQCAVPTNSSSPGVKVVYIGIYKNNDGKQQRNISLCCNT